MTTSTYHSIAIPKSPTQRVYHYGLSVCMGRNPKHITWFSDYGKHVYSSVTEVYPDRLIDGVQAMRDETAQRIKFQRSLRR